VEENHFNKLPTRAPNLLATQISPPTSHSCWPKRDYPIMFGPFSYRRGCLPRICLANAAALSPCWHSQSSEPLDLPTLPSRDPCPPPLSSHHPRPSACPPIRRPHPTRQFAAGTTLPLMWRAVPVQRPTTSVAP